MRKLGERLIYLTSMIVLLTVLAFGVSSKLGVTMNRAFAQDMEIENGGKTCPNANTQTCSYYGCEGSPLGRCSV